MKMYIHVHTVTMRVDSALATRTNTSASKQCLSIHKSRSGLTSIPGLKENIQVCLTGILHEFVHVHVRSILFPSAK